MLERAQSKTFLKRVFKRAYVCVCVCLEGTEHVLLPSETQRRDEHWEQGRERERGEKVIEEVRWLQALPSGGVWGCIRIQASVLWRWSVSGCLRIRQKQVTHLKLDCHIRFSQPPKTNLTSHTPTALCPPFFGGVFFPFLLKVRVQGWRLKVLAKYTRPSEQQIYSDPQHLYL